MNLTARSGPARVLASGEVTTFFGRGLELDLALDDAVFTVRMRFTTHPEAADVGVAVELTASELHLTLTNFNDDAGRGSSEPVLLGKYGDWLLFFHFRAFRFGRSADHTVHYTFYAATSEDVGFVPSPQER